MFRRLSHVGVVVNDIQETLRLYTSVLGFASPPAGIIDVPEMGIRSAMLPIGENYIEVIQSTSPDSMPNRTLQKRGEGLLHIAIEVDDVDMEVRRLKGRGAGVLELPPMGSIVDYASAFILSRSSSGVAIELIPRGTAHRSQRKILGLEVKGEPLGDQPA